jgi:hypothetical protein
MALSKITAASITSNVISSALIANGEITFADIANNTITGALIAANTITSASLANTGVTAGVYGGAAAIPIITVDSVGRLTSAANVAFSGSSVKLSSRSSNTILAAADNAYLINLSSTFTQTFTAAATLGDGWFCYLKNGGSGDITLDPNASETIDGLTSYIMYPGELRLIQCTGSAFTSIVLNPFSKTFTSTSTFTRPPGYYQFSGLLWAGGGSGGQGDGERCGGGGGGACVPFTLSSTQIGSSQTVTIGAGGASQTTARSNGNPGGNTSIGSIVTSYGGGAGGGSSLSGGSGGGVLGRGFVGEVNNVRVRGGSPFTGEVVATNSNDWLDQSFGGGAAVTTTTAATNGNSVYGGGAGAASSVAAGSSVYGGGGGGGADNFGTAKAAGTSVFGGAGGTGGTTGGAGTTPAGGGGANFSGNSGAGGNGQCTIYGVV